jgi:mRNA-degrading endonuclease HigB of HigAB toxin-antitoxin module
MRKAIIELNLYTINELDEKAKARAIEDHRQFELSIMQPEDFISGEAEYDTPEELQKTYEAQYDYYLNNDEPVVEDIEANGYLFFMNGEQASVTQYYGKHHKAGKMELELHGVTYDITEATA